MTPGQALPFPQALPETSPQDLWEVSLQGLLEVSVRCGP